MKKHLVAALVGLMILGVSAPALAANVNGDLSFGYKYDLANQAPQEITSGWDFNINGQISPDVSYKVGFEKVTDTMTQWAEITEYWIQAENTAIGSLKLGAFDMAFGEGNETDWMDDAGFPVVAQVNNQFGGMNVAAGVQLDSNLLGGEVIKYAGASVNVQPMEALDATVGVLAANNAGSWDTAIGYGATYTGIDQLTLGLKGNVQSEEIVGEAAYEIMPGILVNGLYGQNYDGDETIMKVGADATFGQFHVAGSYALATNLGVDSNIISVDGDYTMAVADGLNVVVNAGFESAGGVSSSNIGASAEVTF